MQIKYSQVLRYPSSGEQIAISTATESNLLALARQISCIHGYQHLLETFKEHLGRSNGESVTHSSTESWAETDLANISRKVANCGVNYLIGFCGACTELESQSTVPSLEAIDRILADNNEVLRISKGEIVTAGNHVPAIVPGPTAQEAMKNAISDAENMIQADQPANAVDRLHTALHVYLRVLCKDANITLDSDASAPKIYKEIRAHHPCFSHIGVRKGDIDKIVKSLASTIDTISTIRNQASLAHGRDLLEQPEAHLAVNATKTIFLYLQERIQMGSDGAV